MFNGLGNGKGQQSHRGRGLRPSVEPVPEVPRCARSPAPAGWAGHVVAVLRLEGGVAVAAASRASNSVLPPSRLRFPLLLGFLGLFAFEIRRIGCPRWPPPFGTSNGASDQQEAKHQESGESQPFHHVQRNFIGVGLFVPWASVSPPFANTAHLRTMASPTLLRLVPAHDEPIGGLLTQRAFPTGALPDLNPFLFLNHHVPDLRVCFPSLPFEPHPHKGFETLTFIEEGSLPTATPPAAPT